MTIKQLRAKEIEDLKQIYKTVYKEYTESIRSSDQVDQWERICLLNGVTIEELVYIRNEVDS